MDAHTLEKCIAEEGRLVKEQEKCRDELSRLAHLTLLRVEEKERNCRELQKAQVKDYLVSFEGSSNVKASIWRI